MKNFYKFLLLIFAIMSLSSSLHKSKKVDSFDLHKELFLNTREIDVNSKILVAYIKLIFLINNEKNLSTSHMNIKLISNFIANHKVDTSRISIMEIFDVSETFVDYRESTILNNDLNSNDLSFLKKIIIKNKKIKCKEGEAACFICKTKPAKQYALTYKFYDPKTRTSTTRIINQFLTIEEFEYAFRFVKGLNKKNPFTSASSIDNKIKGLLCEIKPVNLSLQVDKRYNYVIFTDLIFNMGFLNLDPKKNILSNEDYDNSEVNNDKNLYYQYAYNCEEAIQFILLHEYAHFLGNGEEQAEEFAQRRIIEVRKARRGNLNYQLDIFKKDFVDLIDASKKFDFNPPFTNFAYKPKGRSPSKRIPLLPWI